MTSVPAFVHNAGSARVVVFFSASATAPTAGGIAVAPGETLTGNAAHVWIRALDRGGVVTVGKVTGAPVTDASGNTPTIARGTSNIATGQMSVGTTATQVVAARAGRAKLILSVGAANTCAFGNSSSVTLTTGFPLQPTAGASITLDSAAGFYAICSATTTISDLEQY